MIEPLGKVTFGSHWEQ